MVRQPFQRLPTISLPSLLPLALLGVLLVSPGWVRAEPAGSPAANEITLEEAVTMALQHNRQVETAALEVTRNEHADAEQRTHRLPEFSATALAGELLSSVKFRFNRG